MSSKQRKNHGPAAAGERGAEDETKPRGRRRRSLTAADIVTTTGVGRRSALALIGGAVGTTALVMGARPAKADRFDVTIVGDPPSDADSGPFADPPGDADISVTADGDAPAVEQPAPRAQPAQPAQPSQAAPQQQGSGDRKSTDTDFGANADTFDNDPAPGSQALPDDPATQPQQPPQQQPPAQQPAPEQPQPRQAAPRQQVSGDPKSTDTDFGAGADTFDNDQAVTAPTAPAAPDDPAPGQPVTEPPPSRATPPDARGLPLPEARPQAPPSQAQPLPPQPSQPQQPRRGSDNDVVRLGDPADTDTGANADTGDRDVTVPGDPKN